MYLGQGQADTKRQISATFKGAFCNSIRQQVKPFSIIFKVQQLVIEGDFFLCFYSRYIQYECDKRKSAW